MRTQEVHRQLNVIVIFDFFRRLYTFFFCLKGSWDLTEETNCSKIMIKYEGKQYQLFKTQMYLQNANALQTFQQPTENRRLLGHLYS